MIFKRFKEKYENKVVKRDKVIKKDFDVKWIIQISVLAFVISLVFSGGSNAVLDNVNVFVGVLIVLFFILIGVMFDMIGIAVAGADEKPFHSMASKRIRGAKTAIKMSKNAEKVSAFCNDVIGDICNIISGSAGAVIAAGIATKYHTDIVITSLFMTSIIASLTIGGKAIGKSFAINKSEVIVYKFAEFLSVFFEKSK